MSPEFDAYDSSGRLLAEERAGDNAPPLSVSELSGMLKRTVEDRFGHVRLRGEISGFKRAASGHLYLCLKDDNAVIDGVMWKGGAQRLAFAPRMHVFPGGRLDVEDFDQCVRLAYPDGTQVDLDAMAVGCGFFGATVAARDQLAGDGREYARRRKQLLQPGA